MGNMNRCFRLSVSLNYYKLQLNCKTVFHFVHFNFVKTHDSIPVVIPYLRTKIERNILILVEEK